MLATVVTGILVFWLAYDDATFGLVARSALAIAVWWAIGVGVAVGALRLPRDRVFWIGAGLLAAFAAWTALSMAWAASNERAFNEFNRVILYAGVFVLAATVAERASPSRCADGFAAGISTVGCLSLGQRFFPDAFPRSEVSAYIGGTQLSYPLEYVNGLGIFLALALPLLLRAAIDARHSVTRAAAVAPIPALAAAIYLTSSRGAVIVAMTGILLFGVLTTRRWAAAGALTVAGLGTAAALAVLLSRPELVDDPLSPAAEDLGPGAAALLLLICVASGFGYAASARLIGVRRPAPALGWIATAGAVALIAVGVASADPVEKLDAFTRSPEDPALQEQEYTIGGHLLSAGSTGRWQFWTAAARQFEEHPLVGDGAGSYEAWWARHGSFAMFVSDAHSLYLEVLGELGLIGGLLLLSALGFPAVAALRRLLRLSEPERTAHAALLACFAGFAAGAAVDWMWELTVVAVVGIAALGLAVGSRREQRSRARAPRLLLVPLAIVAIVAAAIPLAAALQIEDSQAAVAEGNLAGAADEARAAADLQPWAASPYLQLALVEEERGRFDRARRQIADAVARDEDDWRLWLVQARLETKAGAVADARRSLRRAISLNPRSPIFHNR